MRVVIWGDRVGVAKAAANAEIWSDVSVEGLMFFLGGGEWMDGLNRISSAGSTKSSAMDRR